MTTTKQFYNFAKGRKREKSLSESLTISPHTAVAFLANLWIELFFEKKVIVSKAYIQLKFNVEDILSKIITFLFLKL